MRSFIKQSVVPGILLGLAFFSVNNFIEKRDLQTRIDQADRLAAEAKADYASEEFKVSKEHMENLEIQATCLARNVYFEARSESLAGQIAVAMVTLNRTGSKRFGMSICEVVHKAKRDEKGVPLLNKCQFSWYCDSKPDIILEKEKYQEILSWCRHFVFSDMDIFDITDGATYFHTVDVHPSWKNDMELVARIDRHVFYRESST